MYIYMCVYVYAYVSIISVYMYIV